VPQDLADRSVEIARFLDPDALDAHRLCDGGEVRIFQVAADVEEGVAFI